ncbi:MAG: hypothetical protein WCP70_04305 [Methanothrix sp.]
MGLALGSRKIQRINNCSFVNLPLVWTKSKRIEKGDKVSIEMLDDGSLKISPIQGGA